MILRLLCIWLVFYSLLLDKVSFWWKLQQICPKYHLNRLKVRVDISDYMLLSLQIIWNLSRFIKICEHPILWLCPAVLKMMYWIWMQGNCDALFAVWAELLLFNFIYWRCKQAHSWHLISSRYMTMNSFIYDRSKASSKSSSSNSAFQSFLLQMRVSSPFLKVIQ
jgi:hypothetical protein